uniref:Uncharacterized protein n=1 Tax=Oryza brachyantha TaxID=4533 RepID=J3NAA9_ORYBR
MRFPSLSCTSIVPERGPFRLDNPLKLGTSESSVIDLACLMNRLTSIARKGSCSALGPSSIEALFAGGWQ